MDGNLVRPCLETELAVNYSVPGEWMDLGEY